MVQNRLTHAKANGIRSACLGLTSCFEILNPNYIQFRPHEHRNCGDQAMALLLSFAGRQARILPSSRCISTGLVSKSEHPTSTLLSRSLASAWAVNATIGIADVAGLALISWVASQPSISPNATSIRIRSGISLVAIATPTAPS